MLCLLKCASDNLCSSSQCTALHVAASVYSSSHTRACQLLIDAKADVNARDLVSREEMQLQAAAAARIAGKCGIIAAARRGAVADVLSFLIARANCVNERDG